jgi:tetratricopeptide (TPR) repeat protein
VPATSIASRPASAIVTAELLERATPTATTEASIAEKVTSSPTKRDAKAREHDANRLVQEAMAAQDDPSRSENLFKEALSISPKNEYALSQYSNLLVMNHDCDTATPILKTCVKEFPKNQLCYGNLTNCVFNDANALDLATQDCLKSDPKNMMCLNNRGQLYLRRKDFAAALSVFQQMEELNSHATISFNDGVIDESLAISCEGLGNTASAANYYSRGCKEGMSLSCRKSSRRD